MATTATALPACIGVIIDGNRRWAKQNGVSAYEGHKTGADRLKEFVQWAYDRGVANVIAYVFSTENWNRSAEEVEHMMRLLRVFLKDNIKPLIDEGIRIHIIGERSRFTEDIQQLFNDIEEKTKEGVRGVLSFALSYGGRAEILNVCKKLCQKTLPPDELTEETFAQFLWTNDTPDPDMIIRTGGEMRLSNFLLWQSAYSELYFTKTLWPDFSETEFDSMLADFAERDRRHGR